MNIILLIALIFFGAFSSETFADSNTTRRDSNLREKFERAEEKKAKNERQTELLNVVEFTYGRDVRQNLTRLKRLDSSGKLYLLLGDRYACEVERIFGGIHATCIDLETETYLPKVENPHLWAVPSGSGRLQKP